MAPVAPALVAIEGLPMLAAPLQHELQRHKEALKTTLAHTHERGRLRARLEQYLDGSPGGLILVEGPPGSGVSTLLAQLAVRRPLPLWRADVAGAHSLHLLYAQLVACYRPSLPLVDPSVTTDPAAFERLLADLVRCNPHHPVVLAFDELTPPGQPRYPGPLPLLIDLPPGVTILLGCSPGTVPPWRPIARLCLPGDDPDSTLVQAQTLRATGCPSSWIGPLLLAAQGNFLYLRLAVAMLQTKELALQTLPQGLEALLRHWWAGLAPAERQLALLLAAADAPVPPSLAALVLKHNPIPLLARWQQSKLLTLSCEARVGLDVNGPPLPPVRTVRFVHRAIPTLIAHIAPTEVAHMHQSLAEFAVQRNVTVPRHHQSGHQSVRHDEPTGPYLRQAYARHAALASATIPSGQRQVPTVRSRPASAPPPAASQHEFRLEPDQAWVSTHERNGTLWYAYDEVRWWLRMLVETNTHQTDELGSLGDLISTALRTGTLASRVRTLDPAMTAEAFVQAIGHSGREVALKQVMEHVERLPDGFQKAVILRRLGEICYTNRMRPTAMRLLSRALDLEANPFSRTWHESRATLHMALAQAALRLGDVEATLAITERIEHLERRAMVETEVVRHLVTLGAWDEARLLACGMMHETMGAWARAEVGVALVRAGHPDGKRLIDTSTLATVVAWAEIELACSEAEHNEAAARQRIARLTTQSQRDRGLAALARTLAALGNDGAALSAAESIVGVETRIAALIELRLTLNGLVAMLALEQATRAIDAVNEAERAPLLVALAAALATLGRTERALALADTLPPGEERHRAMAKVAVALVQTGAYEAAYRLMEKVEDVDEQAWVYTEWARHLGLAGHWDEAMALCQRIPDPAQQAHALANLSIEQARNDDPRLAMQKALTITSSVERTRALIVMAPHLIAAGANDEALALANEPSVLSPGEDRARYLAAIGIAQAEQGHTINAATVIASIRRPAERARASAALIYALADEHPRLARSILASILRTSAYGREAILRTLEVTAPALARLGGAALLIATAAAADECDQW
ncbi:ATP-binding protein [Candidatus Chloroploca asiatica]|uniref:Uncharacterized protein n=1 Tax=Candidatus Chloroploca asiatica TaxID=1506545 RepID=A0A2H3L4F7_9CHLR|nr:ATP-binding protein [Candidatus Chloroploca asiatica]PDV98056.1 hypothetical protein A9Q02_02965 [Candidatus Chloroploca asiatica]